MHQIAEPIKNTGHAHTNAHSVSATRRLKYRDASRYTAYAAAKSAIISGSLTANCVPSAKSPSPVTLAKPPNIKYTKYAVGYKTSDASPE